MTKEERKIIDRRAQIEWDNRAYDDYLKMTSREECRFEELIAIIGNMTTDGLDIKAISKYVNLPEDKIIKIITSIKNNNC